MTIRDAIGQLDVLCVLDAPSLRTAVDMAKDALREQQAREENLQGQWISVKDRLPDNEQDVLVCVEREHYAKPGQYIRFVTKAFYTDGRSYTEDSAYYWDDCNFEYDERLDSYIIPEGWWETADYIEEFRAVSDSVTHWMPLPELPKKQIRDFEQ